MTLRFLFTWFAVTFLLLLSVVLVDVVYMAYLHLSDKAASAIENTYLLKDMLLGIASEGFRALLLCYLFPKIKGVQESADLAIKYGLAISGLIGSMWLIIGYGSFTLKDPTKFVIYDSVILVLQGILSGLALHAACRKNYLS